MLNKFIVTFIDATANWGFTAVTSQIYLTLMIDSPTFDVTHIA